MIEEGIQRVTIRVPEDLYMEYKKVLLSRKPRTNTTIDLLAHMQKTVDEKNDDI